MMTDHRTQVTVNWRDMAACRGMPPDVFYPEDPTNENEVAFAKMICASCPVREQCGQWACDTQQRDGIWGGELASALTCEEYTPIELCYTCDGDLIPIDEHTAVCVDCGARWFTL